MRRRPRWVSVEEWLLLYTLLTAREPMGLRDVVQAVHPAARRPGGRTECEAEDERRVGVFLGLRRRGLVQEAVARDRHAETRYELTSAGRATATGVDRLWAAAATGATDEGDQRR